MIQGFIVIDKLDFVGATLEKIFNNSLDQVGINQLDLIECLPGWLPTGQAGVNSMKWASAGLDNVGIDQTGWTSTRPGWHQLSWVGVIQTGYGVNRTRWVSTQPDRVGVNRTGWVVSTRLLT